MKQYRIILKHLNDAMPAMILFLVLSGFATIAGVGEEGNEIKKVKIEV